MDKAWIGDSTERKCLLTGHLRKGEVGETRSKSGVDVVVEERRYSLIVDGPGRQTIPTACAALGRGILGECCCRQKADGDQQ